MDQNTVVLFFFFVLTQSSTVETAFTSPCDLLIFLYYVESVHSSKTVIEGLLIHFKDIITC